MTTEGIVAMMAEARRRGLFDALFEPGDRLRLAIGGAERSQSVQRDEAVGLVRDHTESPNLFFSPSAHDGLTGFTKERFTLSRAIGLDIDYGEEGHKAKTPFRTLEETVGYLLTVPFVPSVAWHTGHGVQVLYLLKEPYRFDNEEARDAFEDVGKALKVLLQADAHQTPERLLRVPETLNAKPDLPVVRGAYLWFRNDLRYGFNELREGMRTLDLPEDAPPAMAVEVGESAGRECAYEDLPSDLREDIEASHEDRSVALFRLVSQMARAGYDDRTIRTAMERGPDFRAKYGKRLQEDVTRCLKKVRAGPLADYRIAPQAILSPVTSEAIALDSCMPLPPELDAMLTRYEGVVGVTLPPWVRESARLHEHLFRTHPSGVVEVPCGYGKTTWAICHIACHATDSRRHFLVTETVLSLHRLADILDKLATVPVGRVHSFNAKQCQILCGIEHTWQECSEWNPQRACAACAARDRCVYFRRSEEERKPVQVITHSGLVKLLERDDALLEEASIIVDEHLVNFTTTEFSKEDLALLRGSVTGLRDIHSAIRELFRFTTLSPRTDLMMGRPVTVATSFAMKFIVHADHARLTELQRLAEPLRRSLATIRTNPFSAEPHATERLRDVLLKVYATIWSSSAGDAALAYHEREDAIVVKKRRFSLGIDRTYRSLWILNASAALSPEPYPDRMPVFRCADFAERRVGQPVTLHVFADNPFASNLDRSLRITEMILKLGGLTAARRPALVVTDKKGSGLEEIKRQLPAGAEMTALARGYLRGTNEAGHCTLGVFSPLPLFTTIEDVGLHVALHHGRSFPLVPHLFAPAGQPAMSGKRFRNGVAQQYYMLGALDLLYQAIWRTAVRNGAAVDAVVAVPDPEWLTVLISGVMPGSAVGYAYRERKSVSTYTRTTPAGSTETVVEQWDFEQDNRFAGLREVLAAPAGTRLDKRELAERFGYGGADPWAENRERIWVWIAPFVQESEDKHAVVRI